MTTAPDGLVHATAAETAAGTSNGKFRRSKPTDQHENPFIHLIPNQDIAHIPSFTLESGATLHNVPVAYKTYGKLSPAGDNAMVICHALTGSADVQDWWGPLLGGGPDEHLTPGKAARAFDMSRFFIVCMNSLGSPYGSASPVTARDGQAGAEHYGPEFPLTTVRDDVNLFRVLLDDLGVKQIAVVIGGSMGGMLVLEFAYFGRDYVRTIIPIATSARYSAWGISWGEAQRQSIYCDPKYDDGYYPFNDPPSTGLGAARMSALLTYRSRDSFEARFGRNRPDPSRRQNINGTFRPSTPPHDENEHFAIHNEGHKKAGTRRPLRSGHATPAMEESLVLSGETSPQGADGHRQARPRKESTISTYYSAQSYLRYQGEKFIARFDANCYIAITRKLDTHDVSRGRTDAATTGVTTTAEAAVRSALALITQPTLVLGIQSDGLFTYAEQVELAAGIPNAELKNIDSSEGHDAFLLEFKQVNSFLREFLERELGDIMSREPVDWTKEKRNGADGDDSAVNGDKAAEAAKASVFGEAEVDDITAW